MIKYTKLISIAVIATCLIIGSLFVYCTFFGSVTTNLQAYLTITSTETTYSISQSDFVLATLTVNGNAPFSVDYYINGEYFNSASGIFGVSTPDSSVRTIPYGFNVADPIWGFTVGQNTIQLAVTDVTGSRVTTEAITFMVSS